MEEFKQNILPFLLIFSSLMNHAVSAANDTLNISSSIRDGETLVSSGGVFELGFFSPPNSRNRYVGIWYKNIPVQTLVWVANRQSPLTTRSCVLKLMEPGVLALLNQTDNALIWSTNYASATAQNPTAQLLDSGNLVLKDAMMPENFLWQSFNHPSDTFLAGMSLGWNLETEREVYLSAWRSSADPEPSEFTAHLDHSGYPQIFIKRGGVIQHRFGPWNGVRFSGVAGTRNNPTLKMNKNEVMYKEENVDPTAVTKTTLSHDGTAQRWTLNDNTSSWNIYNITRDNCDSYSLCGANGVCEIGKSQSCACLDRFVQGNNGDGCVRRTPLNCGGDVFVKYSGIKLPEARNSSFNDERMPLADCEAECSRNCSCTAYTQLDIREAVSGCLFYNGDLLDIRSLAQGGQDIYIRMASADLESKGKKRVIFIAGVTSAAGIVVVCLSLILICTRRRKKVNVGGLFSTSDVKEADLEFLNLSTILKATDHFSVSNKLGQGGFGPVYKGKMEDGREIAVKRLSKTSSQGVDELKNEVVLIAKLQHRNLVRLLGCCVEGEENMLIYEYMPNKSLDLMLFNETKSVLQLDWGRRFNIINGIAKGLLYLHQDSRLRIIHRDLKASNILLDAEMNPKISDFGLARSVGGNETEAQTHKVVGTYGYMSPEYAILDGLFSIKSDVFSFGVLVLEIVSGKRNRGFSLNDHNLNLLGHAWTLYKEDKSSQLVDASVGDSMDLSQALRSIHVGLLCVQKSVEDRPTMSSVVFMLGNEVALPQVKEPGFFTERDVGIAHTSKINNATRNQVTITLLQGR